MTESERGRERKTTTTIDLETSIRQNEMKKEGRRNMTSKIHERRQRKRKTLLRIQDSIFTLHHRIQSGHGGDPNQNTRVDFTHSLLSARTRLESSFHTDTMVRIRQEGDTKSLNEKARHESRQAHIK
jgi:hypothetical protein